MYREYNLIGVLMGLAVYNSIILDLHFPSICYRKLLTPPVVPQEVSVVGKVGTRLWAFNDVKLRDWYFFRSLDLKDTC